MKLTYEILVSILTTHYVDSIIINGRIIACQVWYNSMERTGGYDCVDITDWPFTKIKYDLLGY